MKSKTPKSKSPKQSEEAIELTEKKTKKKKSDGKSEKNAKLESKSKKEKKIVLQEMSSEEEVNEDEMSSDDMSDLEMPEPVQKRSVVTESHTEGQTEVVEPEEYVAPGGDSEDEEESEDDDDEEESEEDEEVEFPEVESECKKCYKFPGTFYFYINYNLPLDVERPWITGVPYQLC